MQGSPAREEETFITRIASSVPLFSSSGAESIHAGSPAKVISKVSVVLRKYNEKPSAKKHVRNLSKLSYLCMYTVCIVYLGAVLSHEVEKQTICNSSSPIPGLSSCANPGKCLYHITFVIQLYPSCHPHLHHRSQPHRTKVSDAGPWKLIPKGQIQSITIRAPYLSHIRREKSHHPHGTAAIQKSHIR